MWGVGSGKKIEQGEKREKYSFLTRKKKKSEDGEMVYSVSDFGNTHHSFKITPGPWIW